MPTTKQRINLSVTTEMGNVLEELAVRDQMSLSTKTLELIRMALEIEEDAALIRLLKNREKEKAKFISHTATWV